MTADPLTGGTALGRYRIESLTAHGGMASVYLARDPVLSRPVAIKVMHTHLAADPGAVARFRHEALSAAQLSHPGIVSIFDTGDVSGRPCLVMEHLSGGSLADRLAHGPLPVEEAVTVGVTVARALHEAHRHDVIHRDVKPANILFTESGTAKLGDFGIAKAGADGFTQTGQVIGTARYLAPEQLRGQSASPASDQFALGVVLYEAIAGRPPFGGPADPTGGLVRKDPIPPLRHLAPHVAPPVEAVIMRALDDDPSRRYPDLEAMARALQETGLVVRDVPPPATMWHSVPPTGAASPATMLPPPVAATSLAAHQVAASSPPVPVPPPRRRRRGVWAAVLLVVLLAGGAVALLAVLASQRESATGSTAEPTTEPAAGPVTLAAAQDFDPPPGSGEEHHPEVGLAIDGNPDTVWTSERYNQQFPSLKPGVGIWVDLGSAQHVTSVAVLSPSKGWKAEVRVADAPTAPASLDGFAKAGDVSDAAPRVPVDARARRVLIWIVQLPTSELRMSIGEVQVFTG